MTASAMILASLLLIWAAHRLRARWVAWASAAPVFLALGLLPVHGAAEDPTLEVGVSGDVARYSVCGTVHTVRGGGARVSYQRPVHEQVAVTATAAVDLVEHEADPELGLPDTDTNGYGLVRVGAFNRWASAQLGVGGLVRPGDLDPFGLKPSLAGHVGPHDMVYLSGALYDNYIDSIGIMGRVGVTAVVPLTGLQRWELGLGVTQLGVYTETTLRSERGLGLRVYGMRARSGSDLWHVNVGLSFRAAPRDY